MTASPSALRPTLLSLLVAATTAVAATGVLADWPPPVPGSLVMTVRETAGISRTNEVVRSGVPLPRGLAITSTAGLAVVDGASAPVPAEMRILARWDAGLAATAAPIQWLLVSFPATVAANGTASYRLITDGSVANPAPTTPVSLTRVGDQVTVETGAARFVLGGGAGTLFDEVRLGGAGGDVLATAGSLTATASATEHGHPTTRRVYVEHQGPLSAVVVVEGAYAMPALGGGGLGSRRRYVFTAGSPTAIVRHSLAWEGSLCQAGEIECNGSPNGVRLSRVRDRLSLSGASPRAVTAVGDREAAAVSGSVGAGQEGSVRQLLRPTRGAPRSFQVSVPGTGGAAGEAADGSLLAASAGPGTLAAALSHMHRYEPQALRVIADGSLAIDLVDGDAWLADRQGLFATLALSALGSGPTRADLDRLVWAPLNRPLRAWPSPEWFASSEAVEELPVGGLPANLALYDQLVPAVLSRTVELTDDVGLNGIQTFGLQPRIWGNPIFSDEVDCGGNDPTPGETWDDLFWCTTFTDYHSTNVAAPIWAMRSGSVDVLDELSQPAALRMLHTQILQCGPGDAYFYCGQAPTGYGGYRSNFNSSHAYLDNLILYYWLTGDGTVVETLRRGASAMRNYLCFRRPAQACQPDDLPADFWAQLTGRVAQQWNAALRFVGLASDDGSYLDDFRGNLARASTQQYLRLTSGGASYGFLLYGGDFATAPGPYSTDQIWMISLYDMNLFYRLMRDTNDSPIGNPAASPSSLLTSWGRTLRDFGSQVAGDGTAAGTWPNTLQLTWSSGARLGGILGNVTADTDVDDNGVPCDDDGCLYEQGKATLAAALVRAGDLSGEASLTALGEDVTERALSIAWNGGSPVPLGKEQGEYLSRLHAAVARLALASSPCGNDATPPAVTPPAAVTVRQTSCATGPGATLDELQARAPADAAALAAFLAGGSATDGCSSPTRLAAQLAGADVTGTTRFPAGTSTVTFRFQDGAGNVGTASASVRVRRQGDVDEDGDVDVSDVIIVQALIVGNLAAGTPPFLTPSYVADADGNGTIDIFDVVLAQAFIVGNVGCLTP